MGKKSVLKSKKSKAPAKFPKLFRIFENIKYEVPILVILLIVFAMNNKYLLTDPYFALHIFDYRIGFAPRLFIGSVMSLFTSYKSLAFMIKFLDTVCILTIILFSFAAGRIIRKSSDETKATTIVFTILFLAVPSSVLALTPRLLSLDRFLILFTLLALMALDKKVIKWFVPLLLFMGLATYQGFAFTYMPAVAILLLYEVYRNKNSKQSILLCCVCFVTMAVFAAYFFLYKGLESFKNVNELLAYASNKTDIRNHISEFSIKDVLNALLLEKPADLLWKTTVPHIDWEGFKSEFIRMAFLTPLLIIFFLVWKNAIKAGKGKFEKFIYILCMLAPLMRLPMMILSTNFNRGRISVIMVQFFLVFYFLYSGNPTVSKSAEKIGNYFRKNYILLLALILYFVFCVKQP